MVKKWLRIMLIPFICVVWMFGWVLYHVGSSFLTFEKKTSLDFTPLNIQNLEETYVYDSVT